jgi:hypothetical protein
VITTLLLTALLTADAPRIALLVSDNVGSGDELPLRSTSADAARIAAVLEELGGFASEDVHRLDGKTAGEILDAVEELVHGAPASLFLFFYSGHADAGSLHPAGTVLPVELLLHRLRAVPAEVRIAVLDACQSGAAAKGSRPIEPFELRLDDHTSEGDILISSSAGDEQSFEGEHGGLFTLHLTAGLRGAADSNGDGLVTVTEVYEYSYAQTLRSTLAAATGPQHARFKYDLAGRRDPVLTRLGSGALLSLRAQSEGDFVIFDGAERNVVAEIPAGTGETRRIALAPGPYLVRLRDLRSLRVAKIQLADGDDRVLSSYQMQEVPLVRLVRKGALGERWLQLSLGQLASGFGPRGIIGGTAGLEYEGGSWVYLAEVELARGPETHDGLSTQDTLGFVGVGALWTLRLSGGAVRLGPVLGGGTIWQTSTGHASTLVAALRAGLRLRIDLQLTEQAVLSGSVDGGIVGARDDGLGGGTAFRAGSFGLFPTISYGLGVRVAI